MGRERRPANERDLQIEIDKQGFVSFDGTCVSLLSQIALFSSVRQLIGVHGAAFADIVLRARRVDDCDVFSSMYMPDCYSALAAIRSGGNPRPTNLGLLISGCLRQSRHSL